MMDREREAIVLMYLYMKRKRHQSQRREWIHSILQRRRKCGEYHLLVKELQLDSERFKQYFRMSRDQFNDILALVGPTISKKNTNFRRTIPPQERLAITLRYLATGDSITTIAFSYRVGESTLQNMIPEVCEAIWEKGSPVYLTAPQSEEEWIEISNGFKTWNFPNCLGSLDGKHVLIEAPPNTGSRYFNYKGTFSIVLLALVDANYRFLIIDVGSFGRNSDGGTFAFSTVGQALEKNKLNLPKDCVIPGDKELGPMPYAFIADEAFPLKRHIMRPYPGRALPEDKRIFNYRLSRARRVVENAFGILSSRWRIFHRKNNLKIESIRKIVLASCVLHNFLLRETPMAMLHEDCDLTKHAAALRDLDGVGNHPGTDAMQVRDKFRRYFSSPEGEVPWQYAHVRK